MLVYNSKINRKNNNKTPRLSEKFISSQKSVEGIASKKQKKKKEKTLSVDSKNFLKSIGFKLTQK